MLTFLSLATCLASLANSDSTWKGIGMDKISRNVTFERIASNTHNFERKIHTMVMNFLAAPYPRAQLRRTSFLSP